jgi:hypothetical protein
MAGITIATFEKANFCCRVIEMIHDVRVCLIEDFEILIGHHQSPPSSSQDGGPLDEPPSRRDEEDDDDVPSVAVATTTGAI